MSDDEAKALALKALKPFGYFGGLPSEDALITAVAKAIKQAHDDGWDRGTR